MLSHIYFQLYCGQKHFFQKVLKKWSSIQKIENIFITFYGGAFPKSIILDSLFALFSLVEIWSYWFLHRLSTIQFVHPQLQVHHGGAEVVEQGGGVGLLRGGEGDLPSSKFIYSSKWFIKLKWEVDAAEIGQIF